MAAESQAQRPFGKGLALSLAALYAYGVAFYVTQNQHGRLGGPITVENALWLTYALAAWFVLPAFVAFNRRCPAVLRRIYGIFLGGFVARGIWEMYLLLGPKAWIPPYGITHDGLSILAIAGLSLYHGRELAAIADPVWRRLARSLNVVMVALVGEMTFAWMFFNAVRHDTHFLWYAAYEPRFGFLNLLMRMAVIAVHADLVLTLWTIYRPGKVAVSAA